MGVIHKLLLRRGYVRLSDYGMELTPDGRIVPAPEVTALPLPPPPEPLAPPPTDDDSDWEWEIAVARARAAAEPQPPVLRIVKPPPLPPPVRADTHDRPTREIFIDPDLIDPPTRQVAIVPPPEARPTIIPIPTLPRATARQPVRPLGPLDAPRRFARATARHGTRDDDRTRPGIALPAGRKT